MEEKYSGKVRLNYDFHKRSDGCSDRDVTEGLLSYAKENGGLACSADILKNNDDRFVLYNFSPFRENIIKWYPFKKGASILEIGSGCGAVTGALCRNGADVTCIELSEHQALIAAYRHKDAENLEIYIGRFSDVVIGKRFDYITLIGACEQAMLHAGTANAFAEILTKARSLLNPGGRLIMAAENKYGLKYWAGAREEHTAGLFSQSDNNQSSVSALSKNELTSLLQSAGFSQNEYYYPYPDHILPQSVYSDRCLPKAHELSQNISYDDDRITLFSEHKVYESLIKNGMYDLFSNSYLIISE
ncbi:MAG: methyltransferase domain-containing protein [Oscillospiraceae bacterium]|nr:methyltransferase domain-containing protein [Oscillospiraceae bacterium]